MAEHTINLDDATETLVKTAAGCGSVDQFISQAIKREAELRIKAGRELGRMVDEAEASGVYEGTLDDIGADMDAVIRQVETDKASK